MKSFFSKFLLAIFLLVCTLGLLIYPRYVKKNTEAPAQLGLESTNIQCRGTGSKSYIAKGSGENITISTQVYQNLGTVNTGGVVAVGVMAVGNGQVTVTDSKNNPYILQNSQAVPGNPSAKVYLFISNIVNTLPTGSIITVNDTNAKGLSFAVIGCNGTNSLAVVQSGSGNGYSSLPISPALNAVVDDVLISIVGVNAKSTSFGLGYPSTTPPTQLECQNAGMQSGSDANAATIEMCFSVAKQAGTTTMQQNIVDTKRYLDPTATPKVNWGYAVGLIR